MNDSPDRLYNLLPAIYRQRDAERGYPLKALLRVVGEQATVIESDIDQLYENWFIETCQDWVVPYIGDLVGYRPIHQAGDQLQPGDKILIPRREVANTIRYRRRKGTLALLEELALAVSGWPARAVEFYKLLAQTQSVKHLRPEWGQTVDLRRGLALARLAGPFDELAHTVDVRRLNSSYSQGWYNLPNIGLFVWRTRTYSINQASAKCPERILNRYTFSILGNDAPLYRRPESETTPTDIAGEAHLPGPITRRMFEADKIGFYGPGRSLQLWVGTTRQPIPLENIVVADLSDWQRYQPALKQVAIDPELGRILFNPRAKIPDERLWVSYYYGFAADIGGGEYERSLTQPAGATLYRVGAAETIKTLTQALGPDHWQKDKPAHAVIEISDSLEYSEILTITLAENQTLQLRAAKRTRPVIRQTDETANAPDVLTVNLASGSRFTLDGLLITGQGARFRGPTPPGQQVPTWDQPAEEGLESPPLFWNAPAEVIIRHTTLVPGWTLEHNCEPGNPTAYSLTFENLPQARVKVERSIIGSIKVSQDEVLTEPISIQISDSILDATRFEYDALSAGFMPDPHNEDKLNYRLAHAVLTMACSTVFGQIHTHAIDLAENSIFDHLVKVGRRQRGCIRFCYVDHNLPGTRTPRRYNCQPDLVEQAVWAEFERGEITTEADRDLKLARERLRVRPLFQSVRYGKPTYAQLAEACAVEITQGADDESEMGVFHHLYNPQRETNLRARLQEYTPADMEVGLIIVT